VSTGEETILELAQRLAEGEEVDWNAAVETAAPHRRVLQNLQRIAAVAALFEHDPPRDANAEAAETPPFSWGHLQVLERLGAGGFGEVYRAFDPVLRRDVALKLRRRERRGGPASDQAYVEEARRLARVRHPNVLAVHGADVHDDRAGLWADLVQGRTLEVEIQIAAPLPTERALTIGTALAEALLAVHQAGLAHGDVKASNVMLDDGGRVVLMDFGAGADLAGRQQESTPAGSPLCMAPERFDGAPPSQAADLYSLGVLLFRMTSRRYPVEASSLAELEARHRTGERTSLRLVAKRAPGDLARLVDELLAPLPELRPSSEEVLARLRFIREAPRRRRRRAAIATVLASLVIGLVIAVLGYLRAHRAEQVATAAFGEAQATNDFLVEVLSSPRSTHSGGQVKVADVLDQAVARLDTELAGQPAVRAQTLFIVGKTYLSLGRAAEAEPLLRRAAELMATVRGELHPATPQLRSEWGLALLVIGRLDEARELLDRVIEACDRLQGEYGVEIYARIARGRVAEAEGDISEAEHWLEEALAKGAGERWRDDENWRLAQLELGQLLNVKGDYQRAEQILSESLAWSVANFGERDVNTFAARDSLATVLSRQGRYAEAEPLVRRNLEVVEEWLGETDRMTLQTRSALGNVLADSGRLADAVELDAALVPLAQEILGDNHPFTLVATGNYATRLKELGRSHEAEAIYRDTIERIGAMPALRISEVFIPRYNLAELLYETGRPREALETVTAARDHIVPELGERHHFTLAADSLIGASLSAVGDLRDAEAVLRRTLDAAREVLGRDHPETLQCQVYLARNRHLRGRDAEAVELLRDAVERQTVTLGATHPRTVASRAELASWLGETVPATAGHEG
jgi:tetratricopeptide (TPR) repeat protein